jgi:hypothetical protein
MFINEGGCVISCADGGIFKFLTASMCVTTPRFMTSSRRRRRQTRRSRRPMILTEGIHHDVTDLHGLLHLVVIAICSNIDHQHT